ncbi:hypothetical protein ACFWDG_13980, partial [Peribacillus sp. NPDC060186]
LHVFLSELYCKEKIFPKFFVHTIWTTIKFSIIMIVITISAKGFRLIPYVFLEKTDVFLYKRVKFNILK